MVKGYIIGMVTVKNPQGYTPYMQKTGELVAEYGGSYLVRGLDPLTFRSPNSFMQPFVQRPRGFFHPVTSVAVLDYRTR